MSGFDKFIQKLMGFIYTLGKIVFVFGSIILPILILTGGAEKYALLSGIMQFIGAYFVIFAAVELVLTIAQYIFDRFVHKISVGLIVTSAFIDAIMIGLFLTGIFADSLFIALGLGDVVETLGVATFHAFYFAIILLLRSIIKIPVTVVRFYRVENPKPVKKKEPKQKKVKEPKPVKEKKKKVKETENVISAEDVLAVTKDAVEEETKE